ncbi:hypothetical protein BTJ68_14934 [Hortaea werneckii EXF-2000]|uniref:BAR domain-containing protein n=2 Tax=Hortaea werneckii TaxID=91943 RepID=A0A1Z5SLW0_HORWE|nr:hypothetical protein BTJ68_14934 [Hortaea werneckii EXF-2000]
MKSMQRKFGGLMKRSENQEDVQVVLTEFKTVNDSLERLAKDIREYRNSWEDALKLQYDAAEAFASIYKPIECHPAPEPGVQRSQPAETPQSYLQKCLGLQKLYSDLKDDLRQEIGMIDHKLVRPAEEARAALKGLHKTLKHRENMKLDYERYLSRAEHARKKEMRTAKEEANLATAESNLAQSQIDYQTADDQVKQTFPPVSAAVVQLLPYLMANIVMLQTTLVGQVYTVLDTYTKKYRFPNPAPGDREIVEAWQREFDAFRRELEQGISVIANGKAVKMSMDLPPEKQAGTVTGLGLRNRAGGLIDKRKGSGQLSGNGGGGGVQGLQRPMIASGRSDDQNQQPLAITYPGGHQGQEEDEQAEESTIFIVMAQKAQSGGVTPQRKIELFSGTYFGACTLGGIIACGPTHTSVTPLDLVKCRRQVDPKIYKSNLQAWSTIYRGEGLRGVFFGWAPTFIGYSFQGAGKYGAYEVFKYYYGEKLFPSSPKTIVYLGASATAEFIADIFLCPFEAIKVRMQTTLPPYASSLREGWSKVVAEEGYAGLYKGIYPLWARQIPYTMVKFATFESAVEMIYKSLNKPKESYTMLQQTGVSFLGGYIAGIGCAVVSHPADVMVSKLNADRKPGEAALGAVGRIYKNIGFAGLWNGLPVRIAMIGTLTAFQWLIYDSFKVYLGLPTTGGH